MQKHNKIRHYKQSSHCKRLCYYAESKFLKINTSKAIVYYQVCVHIFEYAIKKLNKKSLLMHLLNLEELCKTQIFGQLRGSRRREQRLLLGTNQQTVNSQQRR